MKETTAGASFNTKVDLEQHSIKLPIAFFITFSVVASISLGAYDFYTRGEAREALVVQRILNSGEWLVTRGYGDTVASKPPLFHWLAAGCSALLGGPTEFSIRFPSLFACLSTALFFFFTIGRQLSVLGRSLFLLSLLFSFEWLRASLSSRVDMVHSAAMSCAILASYQALESRTRRWLVVSGLLLGLSILSKGPVGVVLPMLIAGAWLVVERCLNAASVKVLGIVGTLGILFGVCWYIPALMSGSGELWTKIWYENVSRFTSSMDDIPHKHSFLYLLGMLFLGTLPWSGIAIWKSCFNHFSLRAPRIAATWRSMSSFEHLCFIAALVTYLFFCIPSGKRSVYLLPVYPFLAFLLASKASHLFFMSQIQQLFTVCIAALSIAQFVIMPFFMVPESSERQLAGEIQTLVPESARIYSFGFEFYGASFYADRTIYRLEDAIDSDSPFHQTPKPTSNDVIIVFNHELEELRSKSLELSITLIPVKTTQIGTQDVSIVRIS